MGFSSPKILPVFKKYNKKQFFVSISESDRHPDLNYVATVLQWHLIRKDLLFREETREYWLFFGRIHPEKGTFESIQIARQSGRKFNHFRPDSGSGVL